MNRRTFICSTGITALGSLLTDPGPNGSPFSLFNTNNVLVTQPQPPPCEQVNGSG
ncbi:MAG TPA: hypothetical protein VEH50_02975 [Methylomirabilota bacterium]|nr:hypothetical protein [Methylomirabilota bacterium]